MLSLKKGRNWDKLCNYEADLDTYKYRKVELSKPVYYRSKIKTVYRRLFVVNFLRASSQKYQMGTTLYFGIAETRRTSKTSII